MYIATIPTRISGIPCLIGVIDYHKQAPHNGSPLTCNSDWDYYGYEESDWEVLDRKGYKAAWLAKKITKYDEDNISEAIGNYFK